ncbi:MAG: MarR family transcriptional regulator [Bacteroidia bacterium]|nr:MarR family transcriptional regulator [Bacteroidia bacterium]
MKLEDAIKQKTPFKSIWQKVMVNILYTHNWLTDMHKDIFKPYGITPQQYNVLRILRGQHPNPVSTCTIRERMLDRMSDVSRIVDRLVKKKLVVRQICMTDKRLVDVVISESGLALLADVDAKSDEMDHSLANLTETEAQQLSDLLDKLRKD